jgi:hypothetical protein
VDIYFTEGEMRDIDGLILKCDIFGPSSAHLADHSRNMLLFWGLFVVGELFHEGGTYFVNSSIEIISFCIFHQREAIFGLKIELKDYIFTFYPIIGYITK